MGDTVNDFMGEARKDILLSSGKVLTIRRLLAHDLCDNPVAWTVFNLAAVRRVDKDSAEGRAATARFDKAWHEYGEREENAYDLIIAAAVSPHVYDHRNGAPAPDDAIPLWAIPEVDYPGLALQIVCLASAMPYEWLLEEADRLASFREEDGEGSDDPGDVSTVGVPPDGPDPDAPGDPPVDPSVGAPSVGHVPGGVGDAPPTRQPRDPETQGEAGDADASDHRGVVTNGA